MRATQRDTLNATHWKSDLFIFEIRMENEWGHGAAICVLALDIVAAAHSPTTNIILKRPNVSKTYITLAC